MATAQQLVDQAQVLLLDSDSSVWTEAQLLRFLNEVQADFATRSKIFVKEATQAVAIPAPEPPEYNFPADLVGIDKIDSDSLAARMDEVSTRDMDLFATNWQTATAAAAQVYIRDMRPGKVYRIYPKPTAIDTLRLRYFATPGDVTLAQTPGLPAWTHFMLLFGLVALAATAESDLQDADKARHFAGRYDEMVQQVGRWVE